MGRPEFPKTLREFREKFASEQACLEYLAQSRWPEGFVCPHCRCDQAWVHVRRMMHECHGCGKRTSPTSGTLLHRSHIPAQEWFWAAYLMATHTPGLSALQLQRQLGISSHETTWFMLHRLRKGMVNASRTLLSGVVEADETIIGGPIKNKRGRGVTQGSHKSLVVGAVEVLSYVNKHGDPKERAGRLRLSVIEHADEVTIKSFLEQNVKSGSIVRSDGWKGYSKTALVNYVHDQRIVGQPKRAHLVAPHIHRVFANLKTWLLGTHHGVDAKYLQSYLDEFVFRFNRRNTPMAAFQTLLGLTATKAPVTLKKFR